MEVRRLVGGQEASWRSLWGIYGRQAVRWPSAECTCEPLAHIGVSVCTKYFHTTSTFMYIHCIGGNGWAIEGRGGAGVYGGRGRGEGRGRGVWWEGGGVAMGSHQLLEKHEKPIGVFCMQTLHSLA